MVSSLILLHSEQKNDKFPLFIFLVPSHSHIEGFWYPGYVIQNMKSFQGSVLVKTLYNTYPDNLS